MFTILRIGLASLLLALCVQGLVSADPCPYFICFHEYPAGAIRPVPGSDYVCCDYANNAVIPSPCEGDRCYLEAQYFGTNASCVCIGEGTETTSATRVDGTFLYFIFNGSCNFETDRCDYVWDGNDPATGLTFLCINCS